jgi:hypothetical protein
MLADEREPAGRRTIFAAEGRLQTDDQREVALLQMRDSTVLRSLGAADSYDRTDFGAFDLTLEFDPMIDEHTERGAMPPRQLRWRDRNPRPAAAGASAIGRRSRFSASSWCPPERCCRWSPYRSACSALAPFARALVVSVCTILVYYLMLTLAITAARSTMTAAMWLPNVAMLIFGAYVFVRAMRDRPLWPRGARRRAS